MSFGTALLIVIVAWGVFFLLKGQLGIAGRFWRAVGRNPDRALLVLSGEPAFIVDSEKQSGFVGPFFFFTSDGNQHQVYARSDGLLETQSRLIAEL